MINKINKITNNKFSRFLKFIFFLRYLFLIFFVAIALFLFIPQFFDYKKKEEKIKSYLASEYGMNIISMESIKFKPLPVPNLEIDNLNANYFIKDIDLRIKKLIIYPKLFSIYNYNKFSIRKIKLNDNSVELDFRNTLLLLKKINKLKNKLHIQDLNLKIKDSNKKIIELKNINFYNYGFKKNNIKGKAFERQFIVDLEEDFQRIDFKIPKAGIEFQISFFNGQHNLINGNLKGKILNSNYKFDYNFNGNSLIIENFFFRDKNLSLNSSGVVDLKPFFNINLISEIQNINTMIFKSLEINKILSSKDFLKTLNSQNKIFFKSKKFQRKIINELEIVSNLAYGRLNTLKIINISDTKIQCQNNINLMDDYPVINFNCSMNSPDQKNLLKKIKVKLKNKNKSLELKIAGNLNILGNKINFSNIEMNDNYKASKEDLKYFKSVFENIIFDDNFINIFSLPKLRNFILEIS
tara:strand:- start:1372 stop:2772 length:1401 start_codon:yes stop_codon:yes gene_type:complete